MHVLRSYDNDDDDYCRCCFDLRCRFSHLPRARRRAPCRISPCLLMSTTVPETEPAAIRAWAEKRLIYLEWQHFPRPRKAFPDRRKISRTLGGPSEVFRKLFRDPANPAQGLGKPAGDRVRLSRDPGEPAEGPVRPSPHPGNFPGVRSSLPAIPECFPVLRQRPPGIGPIPPRIREGFPPPCPARRGWP